MQELFISVDIETTGPIPEEYSMYQLGACLVKETSEKFFEEIQPLNENYVLEALTSCGVTIEELKIKGSPPQEAMQKFAEWIKKVSTARKKRPVFTAFNATFDWMFIHWYMHKFLGSNPFGISGLDIKAYYMGFKRCSWEETRKSRIPKIFHSQRPHTHNALDDAIEQAELFGNILDANLHQDDIS